jgi:hypothetical protein
VIGWGSGRSGRSALAERPSRSARSARSRAVALAPLLASVVSVLAAAMIVVAGYAGTSILSLGLVMLVLLLAVGWPVLLRLPDPIGSGVLIALTGIGAVGAGLRPPEPDLPLAAFSVLLALSVIAAFLHELIRRDGRHELVESVTGTLSGQVLAMLGAGWLLLPDAQIGEATLLVAAVAVASARAATALPWPNSVTGWVAFLAGLVGAVLAALTQHGHIDVAPAAAMGLAVAAVVAALDRLLDAQPAGRNGLGLLSAAIAPVLIAGTVAYAAVRLLHP